MFYNQHKYDQPSLVNVQITDNTTRVSIGNILPEVEIINDIQVIPAPYFFSDLYAVLEARIDNIIKDETHHSISEGQYKCRYGQFIDTKLKACLDIDPSICKNWIAVYMTGITDTLNNLEKQDLSREQKTLAALKIINGGETNQFPVRSWLVLDMTPDNDIRILDVCSSVVNKVFSGFTLDLLDKVLCRHADSQGKLSTVCLDVLNPGYERAVKFLSRNGFDSPMLVQTPEFETGFSVRLTRDPLGNKLKSDLTNLLMNNWQHSEDRTNYTVDKATELDASFAYIYLVQSILRKIIPEIEKDPSNAEQILTSSLSDSPKCGYDNEQDLTWQVCETYRNQILDKYEFITLFIPTYLIIGLRQYLKTDVEYSGILAIKQYNNTNKTATVGYLIESQTRGERGGVDVPYDSADWPLSQIFFHVHEQYTYAHIEQWATGPSSPDYHVSLNNYLYFKYVVQVVVTVEGIYIIQITKSFQEYVASLDQRKASMIETFMDSFGTINKQLGIKHIYYNAIKSEIIPDESIYENLDRFNLTEIRMTGINQYVSLVNNITLNELLNGTNFSVSEDLGSVHPFFVQFFSRDVFDTLRSGGIGIDVCLDKTEKRFESYRGSGKWYNPTMTLPYNEMEHYWRQIENFVLLPNYDTLIKERDFIIKQPISTKGLERLVRINHELELIAKENAMNELIDYESD